MQSSTGTDAGVEQWLINDEVVRLRVRGSDQTFALPAVGAEWTVGSGAAAALRVEDPKGRVSRHHATLARGADGSWRLRDAGSKNGITVAGAKREVVVLEPGIEVWLGGVTLIAESGRLVALRTFLLRILGWASERIEVVDVALRSIRLAATREVALVVCGDEAADHEDLVQIASALHRLALGPDRPFVLCDPRRKQAAGNVRSATNHTSGLEALAAAKHGSLCVWSPQPPADFAAAKAALRDPDARVQLVVCARDARDAEAYGAVPVAVPALAHRPLEILRIIEEYAHDATDELGLGRLPFAREDRQWVLDHESYALTAIEKATLRLRALRASGGNVQRAAAMLGMTRQSLAGWIGRRALPVLGVRP